MINAYRSAQGEHSPNTDLACFRLEAIALNVTPCEPPASAAKPLLNVEALLDSSQFDHPEGAIRLLETHISWVILTGRFAYKIKKPVNLGFLDFSTLALRKHYCEEELRLNRRLAPQIYLAVVPVTGTVSAPHFAGQGPIIDYAVKMLEFPQRGLLDEVVRDDGLSMGQVDALADQVAAFHDKACKVVAHSKLALPESVARAVDENLDQLQPLLDSVQMEKLNQLREWSKNTVSAKEQFIADRIRDGFVRECHGDLHLGNIALVDGEPVIFDCIEFSSEFRWIDVMSDVAFLTMDFDYYAQHKITWRFINRYLQHTGDYRGLGLLRYYQAYRAAVRAKIAALRVAQRAVDAQTALLKKNEAHSRLQQACGYTQASPLNLTITRGFSGCGKTTITDELLERMGSIRLRSDVERKRLHGLPAQARSDSGLNAGLYSRDASASTYDTLCRLSGEILDDGYSVIVDATFLDHGSRDQFRGLASSRGVAFRILDIVADEKILRERVMRRERLGRDASEANIKVLEQQLQSAAELREQELADVVRVDSGTDIDWKSLTDRLRT